jgi:YD repeat-containing protein
MNHDTIKDFDALGRPTHVLHPDGHEVTYGYQGLSQLAGYPFDEPGMDYVSKTTMVDERDNVRYTFNDAMGQERQRTSGTLQPRVTKTDYDAMGNVTDIQDPLERNMIFTYNALGWMTQMHHPDHKGTNFEYDDMGRKTEETFYDQSYRTPLCYAYDALGRVTSKRSGDCGGSTNTQPQLVYAYDDSNANGKGRLTQMATLAVVENCRWWIMCTIGEGVCTVRPIEWRTPTPKPAMRMPIAQASRFACKTLGLPGVMVCVAMH